MNGVNGWHIPSGIVNNGTSCTLPLSLSFPERFFLRITITGSNQNSESDMMLIRVFDDPTSNCEVTMRSNNSDNSFESETSIKAEQIKIYPNPSKGIFFIKGIKSENSVLTQKFIIK